MSGHSCLNSWLGGNIAARPLDVARFTYSLFATDTILNDDSKKEMLTMHPLTDGFEEYAMAYGLGLEGGWGKNDATGKYVSHPNIYCSYMEGIGHGGLDYGSGAPVNAFIAGLNVGVSLATTSGIREGSGVAGMACNRSWDQLTAAYGSVLNRVLNALLEDLGKPQICHPIPEAPPSISDCVDAPAFGSFNDGPSVTCAQLLPILQKSSGQPTSNYCNDYFAKPLAVLEAEFAAGKPSVKYTPPAGYDVNTTYGTSLCTGTCMTAGAGACWMRGPVTPWCATAESEK